ncbi:hypothetical protein HYH02_000949 [Chlamydomonas schloesseri]|uniref:Uncharacterized protein n=1 Tax=Chlamydomonas schloesseri TaxID=2026947 RepID=A0A835WZM7_9CHLO|nr:hypothetical protein HYH02_000949 [Chlamydomonas schloesseri]|eukprot:KAG2455130.1 hypothetical protein HYH02_000949 [Chlamydomonas schloesseri]
MINVYGPDGSLHRLPLQPGLAGRRRFLRAVRAALRLPDHATIEMSFEVAVPLPSPSGSGPSPNSALINTQDFSLASHIATVNAGIRRGRLGAQGKAPTTVPAEAAVAEEAEEAPAAGAAGVTASQGGAAGAAGVGPVGGAPFLESVPQQAEEDALAPRLSKRHRR